MKKLLTLLSVLTITGSALPTTVAVNSYQKENNVLENLKRNKRQSTTTPIPGTTYVISNSDITIERNPSTWGNSFILRIGQQSAQIFSQLTTRQNIRDALIVIVSAVGGTIAAASGDSISITLGCAGGAFTGLFSALITRLYENTDGFRNLFRNNDITNGLNLAINEDPINQISVTTTSVRLRYVTNICIDN